MRLRPSLGATITSAEKKKKTAHCEPLSSLQANHPTATLRPASPNRCPNQMAKRSHNQTPGPCSFPHGEKTQKTPHTSTHTACLDYKQQWMIKKLPLPPLFLVDVKGEAKVMGEKSAGIDITARFQFPLEHRTPFYIFFSCCGFLFGSRTDLLKGPQEAVAINETT